MKIKKLNKIKYFGQFNDFSWLSNLNEFRKYNFFYGWNYSGKTTLSRVLRCLEIKQLHKDYQNVTFSLELEDNQSLTEKNIGNDYPIRVFNEDFIEDNFNWKDENAEIEPVLILGKESKELEEKLKKKQQEKKQQEDEKNEKEKEKSQKERELQNKLSRKASEIRDILSITNPRDFDRNALEQKIEKIKDSFSEKILTNKKFTNLRGIINIQKLDLIPESTISIELKLEQFISDIKEILNHKASAQKIIEKLNQNARLSQWVKEGIELHKNETTCQFCGNNLTAERLEELNKHFSKEYDKLIETINQKDKDLQNHSQYLAKYSFPDRARLYSNFQNDYEKEVNNFNEKRREYIRILNKLRNELSQKKEKPFESIDIDQSINANVEKEIRDIVKKIQSIIQQHNEKVNSLDKEKENAKEEMKLHYCAEFINEVNYFTEKASIKKLEEEILELQTKINNIDTEIKDIESKIKAAAIGANRINEYLNKFFGEDRLKIVLMNNGRYKLYRNNQIAKNLSTGEKNIISLIYFFAKLEETNFDINNAVIFIDDPVSSLDANHIHRVYAFLSEKIKNIGQLFITTHNFEFFNLLKDLYKYDLNNNDGNFYLIKRIKNNNEDCSIIENLPELLQKFKSEYNYLFSLLKKFNDSDDKSNFEQIFLLPNVLRRFFEQYLFMKYPDGNRFKDKATNFFAKFEDKHKGTMALKIMDEYSHESNPEHSLKFPDIQELTDAIKYILECIESIDKDHFNALNNSK